MTLTREQRINRLKKRLVELHLWTVRAARPLDHWTFNRAPHAPGAPWPTREGVAAFHHPEVTIPEGWPLERTRLELDLGGEGLVRIDYGDGKREGFGLDPNHRRFPLQARRFSVEAEAVARHPFGIPNRSPHLTTARLILVEPELQEFALLIQQLIDTTEVLGGHEVVEPLLDAGERAMGSVAWPTETSTYVARVAPGHEAQLIWELPRGLPEQPAGLDRAELDSVIDATEALRADLRALRDDYPQTGSLALTGHAHIDLAWLWPLAETRRKAARTFSTMIALMDRYPDFRFNQSTAQLYAYLEEDDPELLARIGEKVKAGQWEPIGGMWVEPDTNMPTGESFVRQLLYGQRYFEKNFGRRHTVCWMPDCFGFTAAFPQILKQGGIDSFFTIKVNWSETNKMPYDLFWWEGLDGSRVLAHTFDNPVGGYNAETGARAIVETWRNYRGKHFTGEGLLAFGYGDGGGGPTQEMLERQRQFADFPVVPSLRPINVAEWYKATHAKLAEDPDLPVWVGEMYLELHRGTLTTQSRTKYLHRKAERALITAETLSSMAHLLGAPLAPSLEEQWRVVLRNEFHDILPGSGIREVYQEAEAELDDVVTAGEQVQHNQLIAIAGKLAGSGAKPALFVVNPDLSSRPLRLASPANLPGSQPVEGGSVVAGDRVVAGLSAAVVLDPPATAGLTVAANRLENAFVRVDLAADGTLSSVFDKRAGREALAGRGNQIWAYADKPRSWDAWDIEEDYQRRGEEIVASAAPEIVERGPHRAAVRFVRKYRASTITQTVRLWSNSARVEFKTDVEWHDRRILVKARFPLAIRAERASFECAHGVVTRATHRNTTWEQARFEVPAHRFADLSEHGYGVALLNDGKYGHHALGNELGLSLLRSPVYPDPLADEGSQSFVYALYPHSGDWLTGGVLAEAEDLNQPLLVTPVKADAGSEWRAAAVDGLHLGLSGFKPAEEGGSLILRTYEPAGARGTAQVTLPKGWKITEEVNLLEDSIGPADLAFTPFRLHSWKIVRS